MVISPTLMSETTGYGLTETSPMSHILPAHLSLRKPGSIGLLLPNLEARIVKEDEGQDPVDIVPGEPGELWIRGPTIMKVITKRSFEGISNILHIGIFK
jgi:4-coumarate--CoA ligase